VVPGDTLWALATSRGLTVREAAEVNGLEPPYHLAPGQRLFFPGGGLERASARAAERRAAAAAPRALPPAHLPDGKRITWPLDEGVLLRTFDAEADVPHEGLMLAAPAGTPVRAAADGEVLFVGDEGTVHGTMIILRHDSELLTIYGHMGRVDVKAGERVRLGQPLGTVGESGRAESPPLHFQVRLGRRPVDPLEHLPDPQEGT
jgi:murein DD-endopeptidase MepM/ murein hydrolase activator NlpD